MEDDGDDKDESKRRTRNLSEKKRRDQFNLLINELSSLISINNRKMDKSSVLKSTISFLKSHNEITIRSRVHDIQDNWKPSLLSNEEFTYLALEAVEGFMMVFSVSGRIYYVSESITSLLGYNPVDVVDKSLFEFISKDDQTTLYSLLQDSGNLTEPTGTGKENEIRFQCHLRRRTLEFRDEVLYELIQFNGHFRTNDEPLHIDDITCYQQGNQSRLLFVCTGRIKNPQLIRDVSLVDSSHSEFISRHSLEWKFLFLDHRAPQIIGYLPFEVLGTSGYDYYHFDDLEKIVSCHEALMEKGALTSCYYRFLTKGQQWIWLQTRYYISYHQWNSKPEFIVCTNRVVSYADMEKDLKQESAEVDVRTVEDTPQENTMTAASPSYVSDGSDQFANSYLPVSRPASVKSTSAGSTCGTASTICTAATASVSWPRASHPVYAGSDTASVSGESRSSLRYSSRDTHKDSETVLVPQHGIGVQYLEPAPFVGTVAVPSVLPLPLPPLPIIVSSDQAQLQEQLQKKHEELQEMILRQQEELRHVKEQLLLARLGILQPVINVSQGQSTFANQEIVQAPRLTALPEYDRNTTRENAGYQQQPHSTRNHLPQ